MMGTIQFILGRSGTGKTHKCLEGVCSALEKEGEEPLVFLVPEQATYQAERAVLSQAHLRGFSRLRVLSFNRLAFWLVGRRAGIELSQTGRQMAVHKLLLDLSDRLRVYKGHVYRTGLAGKLSELLCQLQAGSCTAAQIELLAQTLAQKAGQELAAAKWADIAALFSEYERFFQSSDRRFINPDADLAEAKKNAAGSFLRNCRLWVDGFSGFTGQEMELLAELLKICSEATIALCADPERLNLESDDESILDPCSVFAQTEQTYCQLRRMIRACRLAIREPILLKKTYRFSQSPALEALEAALAAPDTAPKPIGREDAVHIAACSTVRSETLWIGRTIRRLVKNGLRYRDIAVVIPNMTAYQHYIESAFGRYNIPYFLDRPRLMKSHPLVELLGSALQAAVGGFGTSDVMSFLKSGMAGVPFDAVDDLENYCRAFGIEGEDWIRQTPWDFDTESRFDQIGLDVLRQKAVGPLKALRAALQRCAKLTAAQFTQILWDFMETLDVRTSLSKWAESDISDQQFGHRQLFSNLVSLLDEMNGVFGQTQLSAEDWSSIFMDALSGITIKLIPPTLDQVLVGSIERSRHPEVQAVFLAGATQKQFPVPVMGQTLLTEQDYWLTEQAQLELTNPYEQQLKYRPYLSYIALTRSRRQVYISYPLLDEKGSAVVPWSGLERLRALFPDLQIEYPQAQAVKPEDIETPEQLGLWLAIHLGRDRREQRGSNQAVAAGVLDRVRNDEQAILQAAGRQVSAALDYNNGACLPPDIADRLFAFPMKTSVTRLSNFAACPYQHFAKYVLGLEPRKQLALEPADVGKFYHRVLERLFCALKRVGRDWANVPNEQLQDLCNQQIDEVLASDPQLNNFTHRRIHHKYIIASAKETIGSFVFVLKQFAQASVFKQTEAELEFGPGCPLQVDLEIQQGKRLLLSGRIDRLDIAEIDGKPAGVVYDYKKSGSKRADYAQILYGLDLQLPFYLLAIRNYRPSKSASAEAGTGRTAAPAGAFYMPIDAGIDTKELSRLQRDAVNPKKAAGLFNGCYFNAIDTGAVDKWSLYYSFFVDKGGAPYGYYDNSNALKPEDFTLLLDYTEQCIKRLGTELCAGRIEIRPYRLGTHSPCGYCDYRPVCRFDWQINDYNSLDVCGKKEALEKMRKSLEAV
ncbi:MAG TPA: exodeoxyribonuclease V subunit gamma [Anaerohalosphaeraceae bacterium]|nr:exodeoxyribonuclease V subunit gamma [Anaerohalosphaeraceae bacterium]HOM76286.1 exodeoxyribonuclease V subunit gamma [Anaerohalosphaeraceae bacterium]